MSGPLRSASGTSLGSRRVSVATLDSPQPAVPGQSQSSVYERSLHRKRNDVSLSAFAYIFSEAIQYCHRQSRGISDLEHRLNRLGYHMGVRVLELLVLREGKNAKRETKILGILHFVHTSVWQALFGRNADSMQVSTDEANQYMIIDHAPLVTKYVSVPRDMPQLNCAALVAGIAEAVFTGAGFPAKVSAHSMETEEHPDRTVFVVKFDDSVRQA